MAEPRQAAEKRPIGQRRLAAIVFTDVVSFSARVQANEALTLRLVKRDLAALTQACQANPGQVLKTTGQRIGRAGLLGLSPCDDSSRGKSAG